MKIADENLSAATRRRVTNTGWPDRRSGMAGGSVGKSSGLENYCFAITRMLGKYRAQQFSAVLAGGTVLAAFDA